MDDDDKESEDEPVEPAPDAAQDVGAKLREVSKEELKQILAAHETWLETGGEEGKQADLSRANLQGAILVSADLQGAILRRADLQKADLRVANLQEANLTDANLEGAKLYRASLQGADLRRANLQGGAYLVLANFQGPTSSAPTSRGPSLEIRRLSG